MGEQALARVGRDADGTEAELEPRPIAEVTGQERDVRGPLAERRDVDAVDVEAMEEVVAEAAAGDLRFQITVRRRDHSHVDPQESVAADPLDLALLQRPQELRLHQRRQLAHLVQEQRPPVRDLQLAGAMLVRAGERAADVPEELALRHRLGQRGAVHLDQRPLGPR